MDPVIHAQTRGRVERKIDMAARKPLEPQTGHDPATSCLEGRHSGHLSYCGIWSGMRDSNPYSHLGKMMCCHYTNTAKMRQYGVLLRQRNCYHLSGLARKEYIQMTGAHILCAETRQFRLPSPPYPFSDASSLRITLAVRYARVSVRPNLTAYDPAFHSLDDGCL